MRKDEFTRISDVVLFFIALGNCILFTLDYGFLFSEKIRFVLHHIGYVTMLLFFIDNIFSLLYNGTPIKEFLQRKTPYLIILLILIQFILIRTNVYSIPIQYIGDMHGYVIITQAYIFYMLLVKISKVNYFFLPILRIGPLQMFVLSFVGIILTGAFLLMMPRATTTGGLSFVDALFTSTSAVCVTGLTVVDTATHFTIMGKTVILVLFQIGGLGLMTFTSFFSLFFLRKMTIREQFMMSEVLSYDSIGDISALVRSIITMTFTIEFLGAGLLFIRWKSSFASTFDAVYHSVFHAVSAFCNAGFSTFSNSLESFKGDFIVNGVVSVLIILGGFGFVVLADMFQTKAKGHARLWSIQTKLVLSVSAILIAIGTIIIFATEYSRSLAVLPFKDKILTSLFQSITTRTAGFNTLPIGAMSLTVLMVMIVLMFIGASPGSTGGGIKTTSAGLLYSAVIASLKRRSAVVIFNRSIPFQLINRALALTIVSMVYLLVMFSVLLAIEPLRPIQLLFELVSAFGTVGLSTGITSLLQPASKIIIILTMFIGRLGPVTLTLAMSKSRGEPSIRYPEENAIMVG